MKIIGIIPARWGSTRLPGKPLALLQGRPLIEHVWKRAKQARCLHRLLIATDDRRIAKAAQAFGAEVVMTPKSCKSGTDRLAKAIAKIQCDVVANIQGDEPFLPPRYVDQLVAPFFSNPKTMMTTLAAPLPPEDWHNPNAVKVVWDRRQTALYFTRSPIPYSRTQGGVYPASRAFLHLGFYAYRKDFLLRFSQWPQTPLEKIEQLEQLRALEHGVSIIVSKVAKPLLSVDTPQDLKRAERILASKSL